MHHAFTSLSIRDFSFLIAADLIWETRPVETDKIEIYGHLEGKVVAKTIVIGNSAVVKGDILFSETLKTEEGADINGYIKKTESTSLEAAQDEFKLEEIQAKESKEKEKVAKKGRPKIVASNA